MFSLLLDSMPTTVIIDNKEYKINSNFRNSIIFELLMNDPELTDIEKIENALNIYFDVIPENIDRAIEILLWFYSCGIENDNSSKRYKSTTTLSPIYDFEYDADYIYSAFLSQYNIDLNSIEYLHWWKFKALFKSLNEENLISKIIGYRSINLSDIKDDEERERYKKLQEIYKIPNEFNKKDNEKLNEIEKLLMNNEYYTPS